MRSARVVFGDTVAPATPGHDLLALLLSAQADIQYLCMGGSCGTCRVRIRAGREHLAPMGEAELAMLPGGDGSERLACQALVIGDGDVVVAQER